MATGLVQMALEHWQFIIDCFALTPTILNNSKRIHLILVPLKSTETRTENFAATKMHLWWHLLTRLGGDALGRYDEVFISIIADLVIVLAVKPQANRFAVILSNKVFIDTCC